MSGPGPNMIREQQIRRGGTIRDAVQHCETTKWSIAGLGHARGEEMRILFS